MERAADGRLRARADALDLTQAEVAARVGVTQSSVQRWFVADTVPTRYIATIASLLGVTEAWVVTGRGDPGDIEAEQRELAAFEEGRRAGLREAAAVLMDHLAGAAGPADDRARRTKPPRRSPGA